MIEPFWSFSNHSDGSGVSRGCLFRKGCALKFATAPATHNLPSCLWGSAAVAMYLHLLSVVYLMAEGKEKWNISCNCISVLNDKCKNSPKEAFVARRIGKNIFLYVNNIAHFIHLLPSWPLLGLRIFSNCLAINQVYYYMCLCLHIVSGEPEGKWKEYNSFPGKKDIRGNK